MTGIATTQRMVHCPPGKIGNGRGTAARDALFHAYSRRVLGVARGYESRGRAHGHDLADLIQFGNVGLLEAAADHDPKRGPFWTEAKSAIRAAIIDGACLDLHGVRINRDVMREVKDYRSARAALLQETGREPTPAEVANRLGLAGPARARILRTVQLCAARWSGCDSPGVLLAECRESPGTARVETRDSVARLLDGLTAVQRSAVCEAFGLAGSPERNASEAGRDRGTSRQAVESAKFAGFRKMVRSALKGGAL